MMKTKDELIKLGFKDENKLGVSMEIENTFRSNYRLYINNNDIYFVNYNRMGSDKVLELDEGLDSISFRTPEIAEKIINLLREIGVKIMKNKNEFYLQLLSGKTSELKSILLEIHDIEMLKYRFYKDAPNFEIGYLTHVIDFAEGRNDEIIVLSPKTQEIIKTVYSYYLTII